MALGSFRIRVSLLAVGAVVAVSTLAATSSGAAAALPVVTVSPSKGLVDLQKVTVTATGFSASVQIATVECRPGALGQTDCDLSTLVYAQSDEHGALNVSRYVRRLISVGRTKIDCGAAKGCILGAGNISNLKQANGQTIFFNPKIPPKVATIAVSPNTKLVDHQLVTVSGKGYAPSTNVYISECLAQAQARSGQVCDYATQRYVNVDNSGAFKATNVVLERRQATFTKTGVQTFDCAAKPGRCVLQVSALGLGSSVPVKAPLTFNPFAKLAVASVQLSTSSQLQDLQAVTLTGAGFTPGYAVNVQECARPSATSATSTPPSCDYSTGRAVTPDFHGGFALTYFVRRDIAVFVAPTGATTTDCAATHDACQLTIQGSQSQPAATIPLTFDPNYPAVVPAISANPNTALTDNQNVTVSLQGFTPNQPVQIIECSAEAITEATNFGYCDYATSQVATPSASATVQTTFAVRAVIGGQAGLVDCAAQAGACVLIATTNGGGYYGGGGGGFVVTAGQTLPNVASTQLTFATP